MMGPMGTDSQFAAAVATVLSGVRAGEVVTYGEVATEAGHPGAARAVANVLAGSDGTLPWWRVVSATGRLAPGHEADQARYLRAEGVAFGPRGTVAMARRRSGAGQGSCGRGLEVSAGLEPGDPGGR